MDGKKLAPPPPFPGVQLVSSWALSYAIFYGACALHNIYGHITCDQSHWWTSCYYLYGAAGDEAGKLEVATLWCSAAQAATTVAALLLARRTTLATAVAFVALAITAANHCLVARIHGLFLAAYPGDALLIVCVAVTVAAIILTLLGFALLFLGPAAHDANAIAQHKMDQ
ncbi:hypothetical protein EJB05_46680 [Eragrostis curvula]|uniref:Uncharacterized protein n=1 Tax=Eragrostis curvula TaxID=38414 RepID=A0A5J9TNS5_9POAL|nr:hypothetical protein EJB05_46680 [Eragrostis curvula]